MKDQRMEVFCFTRNATGHTPSRDYNTADDESNLHIVIPLQGCVSAHSNDFIYIFHAVQETAEASEECLHHVTLYKELQEKVTREIRKIQFEGVRK